MKSQFVKIFGVTLLTMLISVAVVGCGSKDEKNETNQEVTKKEVTNKEPIIINYPTHQIGTNSGAPVLKENVRLFNEKYKGEIEVVIEEIPGDQAYVDKMKILLSADALPDLVYTGGYNLLDPALAITNVVDLTPYLEEDSEWKASLDPTDLEFNSRDGKCYGVTEEKQLIGYFYNKELFAKAGLEGPAKTWDEFFEQCEKLKAAGITPLSMDTVDSGWVTSLWLASMIGTNGQVGNDFMNKNNIKDYNTPEMLDAVTKIQKMFQEYTTVDAIGGKYENAANNFLAGKTAMMANGPWMIPDFSNEEMTSKDFYTKVGAALYPEAGVFDAPMVGYFVASDDKEHADATVKFLKFITSEEAQIRALNMIGRIPPSPKLKLDEQTKQKQPLLAELVELKQDAKYRYSYHQGVWYPNVIDRVSTDYPSLGIGDITPVEFINRLNESAQKNE